MRRLTGLAVIGMLLLGTAGFALQYLLRWYNREFVMVFGGQVLLYAAAAGWLLRGRVAGEGSAVDERRLLFVVLAVALGLRLIALAAPQALSTDAFRYVWDGRVQNAGINPYLYVPTDPALAALRDEAVFPHINRADYAHTIYPPTAQLVFRAVEGVADGILPMKLGMLAFDGLAIGCLIALLRRRGQPASRVLLYAWHPLPVWEFCGSGHVDAAAVGLMLLAFVLVDRRRPLEAGVMLAAATLVKFYPALMAPALYRRWDWKAPLAFVLALLLLYLPYLGAGGGVLGFLPAYASEEGFASGQGLFLLNLARQLGGAPDGGGSAIYLASAALALIGLGLHVLFRRNHSPAGEVDPMGGMILATAFVLLSSPHFAWYFAWLVPFLCLRFSPAHVWLTATPVLIYVMPDPLGLLTQSLIYVPFLLLLLLQAVIRPSSPPEIPDAHRARYPAAV